MSRGGREVQVGEGSKWSARSGPSPLKIFSMGTYVPPSPKVFGVMAERNKFCSKIMKLGERLLNTFRHPCVSFVCKTKMFGVKMLKEGDLYLHIRLLLCNFCVINLEGSCMDGKHPKVH